MMLLLFLSVDNVEVEQKASFNVVWGAVLSETV